MSHKLAASKLSVDVEIQIFSINQGKIKLRISCCVFQQWERKLQKVSNHNSKLLWSWFEFTFVLRGKFYPLGYRKKAMMEWQHLRQGKGQNVQSFTEEFRKQALALNIPLDSPETLMKCIGALHSYLHHSLLWFDPTNLDESSVKAIHLENRGKHEQDDYAKTIVTTKKKEENPFCTHCSKEGHDEEQCWKLHSKLKLKKYGRKGKQKTIDIVQRDLGSNSGDVMKITAVEIVGVGPMINRTSNNAFLQEIEEINQSIQAENAELRILLQEAEEEKQGLQLQLHTTREALEKLKCSEGLAKPLSTTS